MAHRVAVAAGVGLLAVGLLVFNVAVAQETPVIAALSQDHANTSESFPVTFFGQSVSIRGSMALVGVPLFLTTDAGGHVATSGIVEMYEGNVSGTQWVRTGSLLAPNPSSNSDSQFGWLLARSGDRLAVATQNAATELFVLRHGQWVHTGTILPAGEDRVTNESLVFHRDTLAIGFFDFQQVTYQVQVYRVTPSGHAHLQQTLTPAAGDTGAFGTGMALERNLLVVGSPGTQPGDVGQVYVYCPRGHQWSLDQTLQSPTGAANSGFGSGVAIVPEHRAILVGAPFEDFVGDTEFISALGELYVFQKARGVWGEIQETRPDTPAFSGFGKLIAAGGGRVAVGAPLATDVFSASFGPTFFYRWEGNTLVLDNLIDNLPAASLSVWRNRIMVGVSTQTRGGAFFNQADVLTYPTPAQAADSDDGAD